MTRGGINLQFAGLLIHPVYGCFANPSLPVFGLAASIVNFGPFPRRGPVF
jgi:hypothetical protein